MRMLGFAFVLLQYFRNVTRSDTLRERWQDYLTIVQAEYNEKKAEKESLVAKAQVESITGQEKDVLQARTQELEAALNPNPPKEVALLTSRVYLHVRDAEQKLKSNEVLNILSAGGFSVPGIQLLSMGPKETELRYFCVREKEYAMAAMELLRDNIEIKLIYVPSYEA